MPAAVLSGFGLSLAAPFLHRLTRKAGWLLCLLPATLTVYFSLFMGELRSGEIFIYSYAWAPSLGVNLSFYLDGLSLPDRVVALDLMAPISINSDSKNYILYLSFSYFNRPGNLP